MTKGTAQKRAVMKTAAEYRKKLGHSPKAALREAWAYHRSYEPKAVSARIKRSKSNPMIPSAKKHYVKRFRTRGTARVWATRNGFTRGVRIVPYGIYYAILYNDSFVAEDCSLISPKDMV